MPRSLKRMKMLSIWSGVSSTSCSASAMWSLVQVALLAPFGDQLAHLVDAQLGGLAALRSSDKSLTVTTYSSTGM